MPSIDTYIYDKPLKDLVKMFPLTKDFLENHRIENLDPELSFYDNAEQIPEDIFADFGLNAYSLVDQLFVFLEHFEQTDVVPIEISSLTIVGGTAKDGTPEDARGGLPLRVSPGEVISIVGPTGSGKSRLLEDIEYLAQKDSPTNRQILLNDHPVGEALRFQTGCKFVAQLSQNMNFVMDLSVREFLQMHARSTQTSPADTEEKVIHCFESANELAGETFSMEAKVTQLSGGQSRALMIADTAYMSSAPIVLVDEIENAGINRTEAIKLLAGKEKIVFLSTHDPLLALSADKRIVIRGGGIIAVLETTQEERAAAVRIAEIDRMLQNVREDLRSGARITWDEGRRDVTSRET